MQRAHFICLTHKLTNPSWGSTFKFDCLIARRSTPITVDDVLMIVESGYQMGHMLQVKFYAACVLQQTDHDGLSE